MVNFLFSDSVFLEKVIKTVNLMEIVILVYSF